MAHNEAQQLNSDGVAIASDSRTRNRKIGKVFDVFLWIVIVVLACAVLIRAFIYSNITISGESMMSTFSDKEVVGVSKIAQPTRGDVVVFYKEDGANKFWDIFGSGKSGDDNEHTKLIKRVVALAGDKIWVELVDEERDLYQLFIETPDGEVLEEDSYVRDGVTLDKEKFYIKGVLLNGSGLGMLTQSVGRVNALTIPADTFFALGDNRFNSHDSRAFGPVPLSRMYGVVRQAIIYTPKQ